MRWWKVVSFLALLGCAPAKSASESCRRGAAANRVSRSFSRAQNPVADAVEEARCDEMERDERRQAREDSKEEAARAEEKQAQEDAAQARRRAVRRNPKSPELRSTLAESRIICDRQGARFSADAGRYGCHLSGRLIFAGYLDETGETTRVDTYFEDGDVNEARRRVEGELGPPGHEQVVDGFRVFTWNLQTVTVLITSYERGVRWTLAKREEK